MTGRGVGREGERESKRTREGESEIFSVCWFTSQMPVMAEAETGSNQEPGTPSRPLSWVAGTKYLGYYLLPPRLVNIWIRSRGKT